MLRGVLGSLGGSRSRPEHWDLPKPPFFFYLILLFLDQAWKLWDHSPRPYQQHRYQPPRSAPCPWSTMGHVNPKAHLSSWWNEIRSVWGQQQQHMHSHGLGLRSWKRTRFGWSHHPGAKGISRQAKMFDIVQEVGADLRREHPRICTSWTYIFQKGVTTNGDLIGYVGDHLGRFGVVSILCNLCNTWG